MRNERNDPRSPVGMVFSPISCAMSAMYNRTDEDPIGRVCERPCIRSPVRVETLSEDVCGER